jgi:hypothetical protein
MPDSDASVTTTKNAPRAVDDHGRVGLRRGWVWLLILVVVAGGAGALVFKRQSTAKSTGKAPRSSRPVAIATRAAWRGDIGVHLDGLGN